MKIDSVRKLAPAGPAGRNILLVLFGTVAAQGSLILALPLIARLYSPQEYGVYASLTSTAMVVAALASLRLDAAIPLPRSSQAAAELVWLCTLSAAGASLVVAGGLVIGQAWVPPDHFLASGWAWTMPVTIFVIAQFTLWNQVALRLQLFSVVARRPLLQNLGTVLLQLCLTPMQLGAGGLLVGQLAARIATTAFMIRSGRSLLRYTNVRRSIGTLRHYSAFPLFMAPAAALNALGLYLPILVTAHFYGPVAGGMVGLAQQLVLLPAATIGTSVGQVYVSQLARSRRENAGASMRIFLRATLTLAGSALVFASLLVLIGPIVLPLVLGDPWVATVPLAQALCLGSACGLVAAPLSNVLLVSECTRTILLLDGLRVLLVGGAGLISVRFGASVIQSVLAMSAALAVVYVITWLVSAVTIRTASAKACVG